MIFINNYYNTHSETIPLVGKINFEILWGEDSVFPPVEEHHFLNCAPADW